MILVTEEQAAITGNPIKAYEFQSREAYIASHSAFVQKPSGTTKPAAVKIIGANIPRAPSSVI